MEKVEYIANVKPTSMRESELLANLKKSKAGAKKSTYIDTVRSYIKTYTRAILSFVGDLLLFYVAWNFQLHTLFKLDHATFLQSFCLIVTCRCLFPIQSLTATILSLRQSPQPRQ